MPWEEIITGQHLPKLTVGSFGVKSLSSSFKIPELQGRKCKWFVDSRNTIVKIEFNRNYNKTARALISIPNFVEKFFKEKQAIVYRDEDAIYFCPYALGQEHLEKFLREEKILK